MSFLSVEVSREWWVCQQRDTVDGAKHLVDFILEVWRFPSLSRCAHRCFPCVVEKKNETTVGAEGGLPSSLCWCPALCCKHGKCKHALCVPVHWSALEVWLGCFAEIKSWEFLEKFIAAQLACRVIASSAVKNLCQIPDLAVVWMLHRFSSQTARWRVNRTLRDILQLPVI